MRQTWIWSNLLTNLSCWMCTLVGDCLGTWCMTIVYWVDCKQLESGRNKSSSSVFFPMHRLNLRYEQYEANVDMKQLLTKLNSWRDFKAPCSNLACAPFAFEANVDMKQTAHEVGLNVVSRNPSSCVLKYHDVNSCEAGERCKDG